MTIDHMKRSSTYQSCNVSGRKRQAGEIIPAGAELSAASGDSTADKAIDLDLLTCSLSVSTSDSTPWIKVKLGNVHCVREVVEWNSDGTVQYTWNWRGNGFSCDGDNCPAYHDLLVETEGKNSTFLIMPNCKFGDYVKMQLIDDFKHIAIAVYEIAVFAEGK